jgi:hypothetical protein
MQDLARDEEIFAAKTTETRELKALLHQAYVRPHTRVA